ncbi:hypothetical protein [Streptomyces thioluteus]|uniref:hypothetical protein n=1 Tax=Streptomyces thioluteus TaxID=66431 RepID=UPI0031EE040C
MPTRGWATAGGGGRSAPDGGRHGTDADARALTTINCAGSINVNVHPVNAAVDGRSASNFRLCATTGSSPSRRLTISGSVTSSGDLFFQTRTTDSLTRTDTGQVFRFTIDRRFDRDSTAASGNATERGSSSRHATPGPARSVRGRTW